MPEMGEGNLPFLVTATEKRGFIPNSKMNVLNLILTLLKKCAIVKAPTKK